MGKNENIKTETLLSVEQQQETKEILDFMQELTPEERKEMVAFAQGARFARNRQAESA